MGGLRLGRIAGIPITVSPSVVLIVVLLAWGLAADELPASAPGHATATYWACGVAVAVVLVVSLLAHELSHSIVAHRHGMRVQGITLWVFGGIATLDDEAPDARADHRVALAGPLMSLAIGALAAASAVAGDRLGAGELAVAAAAWLAVANLVLASFNVLPGAPLDGGRLLRAHLWKRWGDRDRAAIAAARAGNVLGLALLGLGLAQVVVGLVAGGVWTGFIGWFVRSAARAEEDDARVRRALRGRRVRDVLRQLGGPRPRTAAAVYVGIDESLVVVRDRLAAASTDHALVIDGGIVVATLTALDIRRAMRAGAAAGPPHPTPAPPPWHGIVSGHR